MPPFYAPRILWGALVLAALAVAPCASAQITITQADVQAQLAATGTATSFDAVESPANIAGLQVLADRSGGSQTWDFTAVTWENETSATFTPVSAPVPGSDVITGATHIVRVTTEGDSTAYAFYDLTADAYHTLGVAAEVDDGEGGTIVGGLRFDPFDVVFPLPLTSTSAWATTYGLVLIPSFEGFTTEATETSAVEGWGTLVTPAGSASVLKVRTKVVSTTTIEIPEVGPIVSTDSSYSVEFVSAGGVGASIELDGDGQVMWASYGTLLGGGNTAAGGAPEAAFDLAVRGANPARRGADVEVAFSLAAPADVRLEAFDALGRRVATLAEGSRGAGPQRAALATAGLPAGVYVVRLGVEGRTESIRVTVAE